MDFREKWNITSKSVHLSIALESAISHCPSQKSNALHGHIVIESGHVVAHGMLGSGLRGSWALQVLRHADLSDANASTQAWRQKRAVLSKRKPFVDSLRP